MARTKSALFAAGSPRITRTALEDDIAGRLRQAILKGTLKQGTRMTELDLAAHWNVSQGTIRAALKTLANEGLVENRPRRGTFVTTFSEADVIEIYTLRDSLEALAARMAAEHIDDQGRRALERVLAAMQAAVSAGNRKRMLDLDFEFHRTVVEIAGHRRLIEIYTSIESQTRMFLTMTDRFHHDLEGLITLHEPLARAIMNGDGQRAHELALHHCEPDGKALAEAMFATGQPRLETVA